MTLDPGSRPSIGQAYDRSTLRRSIVHIGVGGFHRSHLATYVDELCRLGFTEWSIVGAGVLEGDERMAAALAAQDDCYTVIERGNDSTTTTVIGSIVEYLHAWPEQSELVDRIASAETQIVSLTVTEGGYPVDEATRAFDPSSANAAPHSAFAAVAAGLQQRLANGGAPITILSCDNVIGNGDVTRIAVEGCAAEHGDELLAWIESCVSFPNSMVDRITPATVDADREWLARHTGIEDRWPVVTEPFRQWVVEDDFAGERPPFEKIDVIVTDDVEPYELMKLRLLNAGHSCMAYVSALIGCETVAEAIAEPAIHRYLDGFLRSEAQPALPDIDGVDIDAYVDAVLLRFANPNIADQIARLCLDGSAKFPKFLVPTVQARLAADASIDGAALALAGWCQYLGGSTEAGTRILIANDPRLPELLGAADASGGDPAAFLEFDPVFASLRSEPRFVRAFSDALASLRQRGVVATIDERWG